MQDRKQGQERIKNKRTDEGTEILLKRATKENNMENKMVAAVEGSTYAIQPKRQKKAGEKSMDG